MKYKSLLSFSLFLFLNFAIHFNTFSQICGTCTTPDCSITDNTTAVNGSNSSITSYIDCYTYVTPITSGTVSNCYTISTNANGILGFRLNELIIQNQMATNPCNNTAMLAIDASRTYTLKLASDGCGGSPISPNVTNKNNSVTGFNPEWYSLLPNTAYVLCVTVTIPADYCQLEEICMVGYHTVPTTPSCGTVGISWDGITPSLAELNCSNNTFYSLIADDENTANGFIQTGFTVSVPSSSSLDLTKIWIYEGTQPKVLVASPSCPLNCFTSQVFPYCSPNYLYKIQVEGTGIGNIIITDNATGQIISTNTFTNGVIIPIPIGSIKGTGTFSGPGMSNYQLNYPTTGNTDYIGSGYGVFNPFGLSAGPQTIRYDWSNGTCSGFDKIIVNIICTPPPSITCGSCATPTCPIYNAPNGTASSSTYPTTFEYDPSTTNIVGPLSFTNYYPITTTQLGTLGVKQGFGPSISSSCITRTYSLKATCAGADLTPDRLNANQVGSGFNPEWDNLPAGTYILAITTNLADALCEFDYSIAGWYMIPPPTCGTVGISWDGVTPSAANLNCSNNTFYSLVADDKITANGFIQSGFTVSVPSSSTVDLTKIWIYEGTQPKVLVASPSCPSNCFTSQVIPYCSPNYLYKIEVEGTGIGDIIITDNATGQIISTTPFTNGLIIPIAIGSIKGTGTYSGPGVFNYQLNYPTTGNTDYIGSGYGVFNPSLAGPGTHTIKYDWSVGTTCSGSDVITVTVTGTVTPSSTNKLICSGTTSTLTATGGTTYNWYDASAGGNNVGSSSTFTTPILTSSTSYWVSSGSGLCESTRFRVDVTVKPNVTTTFTLTNNFCINTLALTLPTTSNNGIIGTWAPVTINTSSAGTNTYIFTPNINQCASGVTETINVFDKPIANATPSTSSGKAVLDIDFTNLSTNATNLNWDFGNGETSTIIGHTSSSYINVGNYTVTLIASNGVCPDNIWTTIITVLPVDPLTISIPNIFTPNNDGVNDQFFIESSNALSFEAIIFNRWGNEMISQNKINEKWDGKSASGKMSDDGVYFIKYKIIGLDKSIKEGVASFQLQN